MCIDAETGPDRSGPGTTDGDSSVEVPGARLELFGFSPTDAQLAVVSRSSAWRLGRVGTVVLATLLVAPILAMIPPHAPWAAGALGGGFILSRRRWLERFTVRRFSGFCPKCSNTLDIGAGERLRHPHTLACNVCHHESVLRTELPNHLSNSAARPGG